MRSTRVHRGFGWLVLLGIAAMSAFSAPAALAGRGWPIGRLPGLTHFMGDVDMLCAGTFEGASEPYGKEMEWKAPGDWIVRPQARVAQFRVDDVIKGDQGLTGEAIKVVYVASLPLPAGLARRAGGTEFSDLALKLGKRRCLLQLLKHDGAPWEVRWGGDSYMVLGAKPDEGDWAKLTDWQRLEREFASAILDPDPVVAAYAIASAACQSSPADGPVLTAALRKREAGEPLWLAREATWGLVGVGDLDAIYGLPQALQQWQSQPAPYPSPELSDVCAFNPVPQIRSRNAVPALVELSQDSFAGTRDSAVQALRAIGGSDTKAALAARLDDQDPLIRYEAAMGLGAGLDPSDVGAKDWAGWLPAANIYDKDPDKVLNNWRRWWAEKGKDKYPSVEAVVAKAELFRKERPWDRKEGTTE